MVIGLSIVLFVFGLGCLLLLRNEYVYRYRGRLLDRVSAAAKADISNGQDWRWRYAEFEAVGYHAQVLQFWRSLDRFYPLDPARDV